MRRRRRRRGNAKHASDVTRVEAEDSGGGDGRKEARKSAKNGISAEFFLTADVTDNAEGRRSQNSSSAARRRGGAVARWRRAALRRLSACCDRCRPVGTRHRAPLRFAAGPRLRRDHLRAAALRPRGGGRTSRGRGGCGSRGGRGCGWRRSFSAGRRRWFSAEWRGADNRARNSRRRRRRACARGKRNRAARGMVLTSRGQLSAGAPLPSASR